MTKAVFPKIKSFGKTAFEILFSTNGSIRRIDDRNVFFLHDLDRYPAQRRADADALDVLVLRDTLRDLAFAQIEQFISDRNARRGDHAFLRDAMVAPNRNGMNFEGGQDQQKHSSLQ